jgi:hypothetical protein
MSMCGRSLRTALLAGLLITINRASGESLQQPTATDLSPIDIVSVEPGDLIFNYSDANSGNFNVANLDSSTDVLSLVQSSSAQPRRTVLEQSPMLSVEASRTGDFVVPIPAIGIGWTLLLGAGMIRVGCKVLRLKH